MNIALATSGLWKLRSSVELMTGGVCCRTWTIGTNVDAIVGWGHKPSAHNAMRVARLRNLPYIAFEDGLLRSIRPGNAELPLSLVMDRTGIYYDARQPSDFEALVSRRASLNNWPRKTHIAMQEIREKRLSKYNNFAFNDISSLKLKSTEPSKRVLVVDQTVGDASIEGAFASASTFDSMLESAVVENPEAEILLRVHPETMAGRKAGYFSHSNLVNLSKTRNVIEKALKENRIRLTPEPVNPWVLLEACSKVYCVSSQLGFEGLMAGCDVYCFGVPFYAGWGLTNDRNPHKVARRTRASLDEVFAAFYFDYCFYLDNKKRELSSFSRVVNCLSEAAPVSGG